MLRLWARGAEAQLFLERLCSDWDNLPPGMRKAISPKDAHALHQCCGLFQHFIHKLGEVLPGGEIQAARDKLKTHFLLGGMDAELLTVAETRVPPGDLKSLGAFRRSFFCYGILSPIFSQLCWFD